MNGYRGPSRLGEFLAEFFRDKSGAAGLALLAGFVLLAVLEPWLSAYPEANRRWRDISYWDEGPRSAPPLWTRPFEAEAGSRLFAESERSEESSGEARLVRIVFEYSFDPKAPPRDLFVRFQGEGQLPAALALERPDGQTLELARDQFALEAGKPVRLSLAVNAAAAAAQLQAGRTDEADPMRAIFSAPGVYRLVLSLLLPSGEDRLDSAVLAAVGGAAGLLGTDNAKRDLWSGLLAGVKWALLIGLATAALSVALGVLYGSLSAYLGGWTQAVMMRIFELFVNIPLLPVLIVLSAVFKPSIWTMTAMMSLFFWTGPVKTVSSMALQIKEETFIEASRALGASRRRIILRHMLPLLLPYAFASMALSVPGAIVYEAGISLIGLGDAGIVTWGGMLHDALSGGAVLNGLWWWVLPPGLAIALMGMTFALIGFAMDRILHPRLRQR